MSVQWPVRSGSSARPTSLAWSNPVARWWAFLTLVSGVNIAAWFWLYRFLEQSRTSSVGASSTELMLFLCAAYVFG